MNYLRDKNDLIYSEFQIPSGRTIKVQSDTPVKERTGVHTRLTIIGMDKNGNEHILSWSRMNIERDEDRTRLTNSALAHLSDGDKQEVDGELSPKALLKHSTDIFCAGLWNEYMAQFIPVATEGAEVICPPTFFIKPLIVWQGGTILFAPPGRGKSFLALAIAVSVDAGIDRYWATTQGKVLFVNLERSAWSVKRRLAMVNEALNLPRQRKLLMLNARGRTLLEVSEAIRRSIQEQGIDFLILDSISRAGFGDLNDNRPINAMVDVLNSLCPTWLALGHTPRKDEDHLFGSIMADAGADIMAQLLTEQAEDGTLGLGVHITKANDISTRQEMDIFALEFGENGLSVFRRAKIYEFPDIMGKRKRTLTQEVREHLLDNGMATATEIAEGINGDRANISRLLKNNDLFTLVKKEGRDVYYGIRANV